MMKLSRAPGTQGQLVDFPPPTHTRFKRTSAVNYHWDAARSMAVTNCSNSGFNLLTAWYDGSSIIYKESPNSMVFRQPLSSGNTISRKGRLSAFPNPATGAIHLTGVTENLPYTIQDVAGKTVAQGLISLSRMLDVKNLAPGLYLLTVKKAGGGSETIKFTKQ